MPETIDSILDSIKKMLGIPLTDTAFDVDVIVNINSAFMNLNQLGIGPELPYAITNKDQTWSSFDSDLNLYNAAKTYVYLKVKLVFDPPTIGAVLDSVNRQLGELEWRLSVQANPKPTATP